MESVAGQNLVLCPWLDRAFDELGVREIPGEKHNPRILEYIATCDRGTRSWVAKDETYWCSAFVNWCILRSGLPGTNDLRARSWLRYGEPVELEDLRWGDILVFWRKVPIPARVISAPGHVAFFTGFTDGTRSRAMIFGGNQDNQVGHRIEPMRKLLGARRPAGF